MGFDIWNFESQLNKKFFLMGFVVFFLIWKVKKNTKKLLMEFVVFLWNFDTNLKK